MAIAAAAAGAEKPGDRGAGAKTSAGTKTAPDLNLDGVWRGFVVEGKGEQPDRGSVHLELTIQGDRITARRLDGGGSPLGQGTYKIAPGRVLSDRCGHGAHSRKSSELPGHLYVRTRPDEVVHRHAGLQTPDGVRDEGSAVLADPEATTPVRSC